MRRLSNNDFINRAIEIHGSLYDYSKTEYKGALQKIEIICRKHGSFWQIANAHLQGQGCKICRNEKFAVDNALTEGEFIDKANIIYSNKYDYSRTIYIMSSEKVEIICPEHGSFWKTPNKHLLGQGCQKCGFLLISIANKYSLNEYIIAANTIHHNFYNYSKTKYSGIHSKIEIICPKHGVFWQFANHHLTGCGCPSCHTFSSQKEEKWLDQLGLTNDKQHRQVKLLLNKSYIIVDGYNPDTNTIYEFYGDFWHGNPNVFNLAHINSNNKKTFNELYNKTIEREQLIKNAGYNLITIWEKDWEQETKQ